MVKDFSPVISFLLKWTKKVADSGFQHAANAANDAQVYGSTACPDIKKSDIGVTPLHIYLYFTEEDDAEDLFFVKTAFTKDSATTDRITPLGSFTDTAGGSARELKAN